jgi:glycerophosphoryl diester phosphodiesterase
MTLELLKSQTGRTLIESHRGIQGEVPENSWPAIRLGHQLGADLIEVDVQMSQDGIPFLRHNYTLPDGRWCGQLPWNLLKDVLIENEPLPKLEDVLVWARDAGLFLSLDIKTTFTPEKNLASEVVNLLKRTNTENKVLLLFIDHNELAFLKAAYPELTVRALLRGRLVDYSDYLQKIGADCASISYDLFRPADIVQLHSKGIAVVLDSLWNPNADIFQTLEFDIFTHGNPAEARKILERQ